jgi:hypothetical protein
MDYVSSENGQSLAGFFFLDDFFTASSQLPSIVSVLGLGPERKPFGCANRVNSAAEAG